MTCFERRVHHLLVRTPDQPEPELGAPDELSSPPIESPATPESGDEDVVALVHARFSERTLDHSRLARRTKIELEQGQGQGQGQDRIEAPQMRERSYAMMRGERVSPGLPPLHTANSDFTDEWSFWELRVRECLGVVRSSRL
jgi:hypothetical protein